MNENVGVSDSVLSEDADIIDWELHKSKTFTKACFLSSPSFIAMWDVFVHTRPEVFLLNLASMHSNKSLKPQKGVKSSKRATFKNVILLQQTSDKQFYSMFVGLKVFGFFAIRVTS